VGRSAGGEDEQHKRVSTENERQILDPIKEWNKKIMESWIQSKRQILRFVFLVFVRPKTDQYCFMRSWETHRTKKFQTIPLAATVADAIRFSPLVARWLKAAAARLGLALGRDWRGGVWGCGRASGLRQRRRA
jgi:hypothetical protein